MDVITFIAFFIFGLHVAGRLLRRFRVMSDIPWWAGDSIHFGVGMFVSRLDPVWAWLVSVVYLNYQVFDWFVHRDTVTKDVGTFLAGVLAGLGYDVVRF
jgi:hypothetical protein